MKLQRSLFKLFAVITAFIMLFESALALSSVSAQQRDPQICEWTDNSQTIWQEVTCKQSSEVADLSEMNGQEGFSPETSNMLESSSGTAAVPWSHQIGGLGTEINDITTDASGNVYVTGMISSTSDSNAFVAKLDSNGNTQWSYSFGGMIYDAGWGIALDASGNIYITGSEQLPSGTSDILLAKLNNTGSLQWKTNWGNATQSDAGRDIALDSTGNIYVTGGSFGSWGAPIRPYKSGQYDAFVAKFNPDSGSRIWNTFLGENLNGFGMGIKVNSDGNVYITGVDFIPSSTSNAFVAGLNTNGSSLWYVGVGNSEFNDSGRDIVLDANGGIYVSGESSASWGAPINSFSGVRDAFVLKLGNGGNIQWNTFVGGAGWDLAYGIDLDIFGNIHISGYSTSVWGTPFSSGTGSPQQVFAAKLDNNGNLEWNTFVIGEAWYQSYGHPNRIATQGGSVYVVSNIDVYESAHAYITRINDALYDCSGTSLSYIAQAVLAEVGPQEYCGNQYNNLITLPPGEAAFEHFRTLVEEADYEVDFTTMIWDENGLGAGVSPGRTFLQGVKVLHDKVQANLGSYPSDGVRVRILVGLKVYPLEKPGPDRYEDQRVRIMEDLAALQIPPSGPKWKVEVAVYRNGLTPFLHSHAKLMIVDGKQVITGGYNMQYAYLNDGTRCDMGVKVSGPIAYRALKAFDELWVQAYECLQFDEQTKHCTEESVVSTSHNTILNVPSASMGTDVVFSLFRDNNVKTADNAVEAAIKAAESNVNIFQKWFVNASFWNPLPYARAILDVLQKENTQVQVRLLASGGLPEDRPMNVVGICMLKLQLLSENPSKLQFLEARLSTTENPIHTKALSIDDIFVVVGSQNFDPSAWGNDNYDLPWGDLAEYSLGLDSIAAATQFNGTTINGTDGIFNKEWNNAKPLICSNPTGTPLQDVIDLAQSGSTIFIPAGVYTDDSIIINKPLALVGAGVNQTILQPEGNESAFYITSSDVVISNMRISGSNSYGIELIDSSPSSLKDIQINRVVFESNALGGVLAQGLISGSPMNYAIENNTFIGGANGITINMIETQAETSFIRNNIFSGQLNTPIHILSTNDSRVEYSYNLFDDCGAGNCVANWRQGNMNSASNAHDNLFDLNPLFANAGKSAYQLSTGSPSIDAGDPSLQHDFFYDGDNDGEIRIDMGAFEYAPVTNVVPVVNAGNNQTVNLGSSVTINATYTDADNTENHSTKIDWGDGTVEDVSVTMTGPGAGNVTGQHTYSNTGNYMAEVCVTDLHGAVGCDAMNVDVISTPTNTPTNTPTSTPTFTPAPTSTPSNTPTFTSTPTATVTPSPTFTPTTTPSQPLYLTLNNAATVGGVAAQDIDILSFNGSTWSMFFDGSDLGISTSEQDINDFHILDADTILMTFDDPLTLGTLAVDPWDVVRFDATSLGNNTAGNFSMYLDGNDVGLDTTNEYIDGLDVLSDGRVLISTTGSLSVSGVSGAVDEDILAFTPTTLGDVTSGSWSLYFDGSDVGLADSSDEDMDALAIHSNGNIYLSTSGNFTVTGISGFDEDVFVCTPTSLGSVTACNYSTSLYFDGSVYGLDANDVDGIDLTLP